MIAWLKHKLTRLLRDTGGAAMIEFTLVAPLIIFLGLGAGEFGRALQHHHVLNKGARDAARYLARVPATCPNAGVAAGSITNASDIANAKNLARTGYVTAGQPALLSYWTNDATITVTVDCFDNSGGIYEGAYTGKTYIPLISVTIVLPYADIGFLSLLGVSAFTFTAQHNEPHIAE